MTCDEKVSAAHAALLQGDYQNSEQLYREILREEPEDLRALDGLAILLCRNGETEQGIIFFKEALRILRKESQPNSQWEASILFHLGLSYRTLGFRSEALKVFTEAAVHTPHTSDLVLNLGQVHFELEQYDQAVQWFRALTAIQPDDASAWLTLGFILSNIDRYEEAAEVLRMAESLDSTSPEICFYLAESLRKAERYEESLPSYQRMLQVATEYPQAVHGYGKSLLALGNLEDGWDAMEFRFVSSVGSWERHALPDWLPETNKDVSHVLAYSEEGIGAELMFASCLPDLINSVDHCVVECESSLHSLFRRSFPRAEFVPLADDYVRPEGNPWEIPLDAQIAFGTLPRHFRRSIDDFPLRKAYLVPDKERVAGWSARLAGLGDTKKIGILWQGTWTGETPKQMSLPLQELQSLMTRYQKAAWICLQHGSHQNDLTPQRGFGISPSPRTFTQPTCGQPYHKHKSVTNGNGGAAHQLGNNVKIFPEAFRYDLDMMAALLAALDLVITPPGYVAHLAGALGVRTWLLIPEGADWRHSIDIVSEHRSVWHPSVKMYRQAKGQTWQHFFATLENDLEKFLTTYRPPEEMPATLTFTERTKTAVLKAA